MEDFVIQTIKENGGVIYYDTLVSMVAERGMSVKDARKLISNMVLDGTLFFDKYWDVTLHLDKGGDMK